MGFTRLNDNLSVHQSLSDEPNIDDGLSSEELKKKFDEPVEKLKKALNDLMNELESNASAGMMGAQKLNDTDDSAENIQAKLERLQSQITTINNTNIATSKIENEAITTSKIADANVTTEKLADGSVTADKINNGSVTGEKIDENVKKALNITATQLNEQDTSEANVQAKLNKIYQDLISMTQGSVADNSITSSKLADGSVTKEKTNFGLSLVPSGFIGMWSGTTIPSGWYLCDGTNGTPDLRNRFIVGSGDEYSIGNTGGEKTHTLTISEMPEHSHAISNFPTGIGSIHAQGFSDAIGSRTTLNTEKTGGGQAHENRPPYYALAFIMKA